MGFLWDRRIVLGSGVEGSFDSQWLQEFAEGRRKWRSLT